MGCKLISGFIIFILVNNAYFSKLDRKTGTHYNGSQLKSDFFIDKVKILLESKSMKENNAIEFEHRRKEIQQHRIDQLRKSLEFQFKYQGLRYKLDPDARKNLTQLIKSKGYPVERYTVKTQDGFLLDLHRIPFGFGKKHISISSKQPRPAIFLQHGFISSACDWVMNFANDSLGFILADHGYDVWMGNSRGNVYSQKHVTLKPDDKRFWDWSFHEMGVYDTPAFLDFILNKTNQPSLYYVGHSQGTIMAFIMLSQEPEYLNKIRFFVGLAPITSLQHMRSPLKYLTAIPDDVIYEILGHKGFVQHNDLVEFLVDTYCTTNITEWLCNDILFLITGPDISNLNTSRVEVYMDHTPAGASVKNLVHFAQMYRQGRFAMYDFGSPGGNMKHYGNATPPAYDVTKAAVRSLLFSGTNDWLADPKDVAILDSTLPNIKGSYIIDGWNHLDFVWGLDAAVLCYNKILNWLPKF